MSPISSSCLRTGSACFIRLVTRTAGSLSTASELPRDVHETCVAAPTTVGTTRKRARPEDPLVSENDSFEDLLHTTLYWRGAGGWRFGSRRTSMARLLRVASRVPPAVFRMTLTRASRRPFSRRGRRAIPSQRSASLRPSSTAARSPTPSASRTSRAARRAARTPSTTSATRSSRSSGACCRRPRSRSSSRTPPSAARPSSRSSTRTRWRRRRSEPVVKSQVRALALTELPILPDLRRCASLPCITSIE